MGVNDSNTALSPAEYAFIRSLLWEEGHLLTGPATQASHARGLSLIRCLEPINRLVPDFQGEALNLIRESARPDAEWPWNDLRGDDVLRLLWSRLAARNAIDPAVEKLISTPEKHSPQPPIDVQRQS